MTLRNVRLQVNSDMLTLTPMRLALCLSIAVLAACGDDAAPMDAAMPPTDAASSDADTPDAGEAPDASVGMDADVMLDAALDAPMADTWASFAESFFADYCVACHAGGTRDYRTITEVMRDSNTIACGVSPDARAGCTGFPPPGQFPVGTGPKPSDAERRRLVAWIDAGLPE